MNSFKNKTEEEKLSDSIDKFWKDGLSQISDIHKIPNEIGLEVLKIIISTACHRQNITPIVLANEVVSKIDKEWLKINIPIAAEKIVCFDDYWEYRRLLELIYDNVPELLEWGIIKGSYSQDEDVKEAVEDFRISLENYKSRNI